MADQPNPVPTPKIDCDDRAHWRLFLFGLAVLASFTFVIYLIWLRELKISDSVFAMIITTYTAGIAQIIAALGARKLSNQSANGGNA